MIITKKTLSRREMLRAAGAAVALPFLDSMIPAFGGARAAAATAVRRLGRGLRAERDDDAVLDAGDRGRRLRVQADSQAARAVSRSAARHLRPQRRRQHRRACRRFHAVPDRCRGQAAPIRSWSPTYRWISSPPGNLGGRRSSPRWSWRSRDATSRDRATSATAAATRTRSRGAAPRRRCRWRTIRAWCSSGCSAKAGRPTPTCARRGCAPIAASSTRCWRRRRACSSGSARRTDRSCRTTWKRSATSNGGSSWPKRRARRTSPCRPWRSRPACRRATTSTRS